MFRFALRLLAGLLSPLALLLMGSIFWRFRLPFEINVSVAGVWLFTWIGLELAAAGKIPPVSSRWLTHLRYGPLAVLFVFVLVAAAYHVSMITHTQWQIRQYVHSGTPTDRDPPLEFYTGYQGWCGNAYPAAIYAYYGETAAEGFESPDPAIRARSLRVTIRVYDWMNGSSSGPYHRIFARALTDPDPGVRKIATDLRDELGPLR
ncbi:MAG: hypothetical protein ABIP75_05420 [Pyrinomonadaceae bacterium]